MKLDLSDTILFNSDTIDFDKPINFVFGKNGTGKSTICKLIKEQNPEQDVRIYQGVESVAVDGKLNSVILGEENILAQKNIKRLNEEIKDIQEDKQKVDEELEGLKNKIASLDKKKAKQDRAIKKFFSDSARDIKNSKLHIASTSYNSPMFEEEIKYAYKLSESEKQECKENIKIEEKTAETLSDIDINFNALLDETNKLLDYAVEEEKGIVRLTDDQKINFAKFGLEIHKRGDICSFCGNSISDSTFDELEKFYSESKIKEFESVIKSNILKLDEYIKKIEEVSFNTENFYNIYHEDINDLIERWSNLSSEQVSFLNKLKIELESKLTQMFSKSDTIELKAPNETSELFKEYNNIVHKNNSEDYARIKRFSEDLLRFDLIELAISQFSLNDKNKELEESKIEIDSLCKEKQIKEGKISKLELEIREKRTGIQDEINKTKSESKLAQNINKKLALYVSFELEHIEVDDGLHKGFYRIKDKSNTNNEYRDIDTLSEGEKNILGFLYFIEKLNEYQSNPLDKIIVFDDPMDSNDDMMQYIIITEIQELMKPIDKEKVSDTLVIMTHNSHFYINVKYNRLYQDGEDKNGRKRMGDRFIRLQKEGSKTTIKVLESDGEDFTTNYELLWKELRFLYDNDKPNLMLNSIRRIIETFTKFNRSDNFYGKNREAQKLFNVNSHSIDDLQAELNGKTKDQIIELMRNCFISNNAANHFKTHWRASKK